MRRAFAHPAKYLQGSTWVTHHDDHVGGQIVDSGGRQPELEERAAQKMTLEQHAIYVNVSTQ